eukprot:3635103-Pleurochrysis_carterae.AAC.1
MVILGPWRKSIETPVCRSVGTAGLLDIRGARAAVKLEDARPTSAPRPGCFARRGRTQMRHEVGKPHDICEARAMGTNDKRGGFKQRGLLGDGHGVAIR